MPWILTRLQHDGIRLNISTFGWFYSILSGFSCIPTPCQLKLNSNFFWYMRRPHLPHSCRVSWTWCLKYLRNCLCPIICWKETCKLIAWLCTVTITCQNDLKTKKSSSGLLCFLWSGFGEVTSLCRWLLPSLNTLPTECFLSTTETIQRGKSEHPEAACHFLHVVSPYVWMVFMKPAS